MEVPYDARSSSCAALFVELHQGRNRGTNDPTRCLHHPVQLVSLLLLAVAEPGREAIGQDGFNGAPIEGGEERSRKACLLQPSEGV